MVWSVKAVIINYLYVINQHRQLFTIIHHSFYATGIKLPMTSIPLSPDLRLVSDITTNSKSCLATSSSRWWTLFLNDMQHITPNCIDLRDFVSFLIDSIRTWLLALSDRSVCCYHSRGFDGVWFISSRICITTRGDNWCYFCFPYGVQFIVCPLARACEIWGAYYWEFR